MPRNDRSDSLSVREEQDPRRTMKGMQQETELELGRSEAGDTGGVEHQSRADREGISRDDRPEEQATRRRIQVDREQTASSLSLPGGGGDTATSSAERTRGAGPRIKDEGEED